MKCIYCGAKTSYLTSLDDPICEQCAEENGFPLCTDMGKYIADDSFECDHICNDCIHRGA